MNKLNPEQQMVVDSRVPITIAISGPGGGKSHTLAACVAARSFGNRTRVVITYTNAAAKVIRDRIGPCNARYVGTLHGYMLQLLQEHGSMLGYRPGSIEVVTEAEQGEILRSVVSDFSIKISGKEITANRSPMAVLVNKELARRVKRASRVTYDDLLTNGHAILSKITLPIDELYVDEAQDSSPLDFDIYRTIKAEQKIFFGDPDQSVYGFRGADPMGLVLLARGAVTDGRNQAALVKLETNYRSGPRICDAANKLIAHNTARVEKWSLTSDPDKCDEVSVVGCGTEMGECEFIANSIRREMGHGIPPREIAVLARYNMLARQVRDYLVRAGVPVMSQARKEQVDGTTPSDMDSVEAERVEMDGNWSTGGGVCVSTIHGAKGQEYEVVFVAGCEEGQLPGRGDMEEQRRICYTAVTRAKSRLILTWAKRRYLYGSLVENKPSRFIEEMGLRT